jgi:DNA-binding GntR family transcriptional regulator
MPVPEARGAVDRHLLRDTAYDKLCEAIVDGTLTPGEPLHDDALCRWLGLSRTPVREALGRLRDERLIEMEPQRYTRVAPVSAGDVYEIVPLLAALHGLATELAVPRLASRHIADLRERNEAFMRGLRARDARATYEADQRFHAIFVQESGNAELPRVLARLEPRLHRLECLCAEGLPGRRSVAQHEVIITRAELGDAPGAALAMRANWMTLGSVFERALA